MYCSKCKLTGVPLMKIGKNKYGRQYYYCRECNLRRIKRYRKTLSGKRAVSKAVTSYVSRNKARRRAWFIARAAHKEAKPCEVCGAVKYIHRHHPDINKPLHVRFLCPAHHKETELAR